MLFFARFFEIQKYSNDEVLMCRADGQDNYKSSYVNMAQGAVDCIFPPILDE